jgi:hypothetical protein
MHSLRLPPTILAILLASVTFACGGDDDGGSGGDADGGISDGDFDNDGIPDDEDDDDDGDGVPDDEDDCPLDFDPCEDTSDAACKHLDIVISVDPSGSMNEEMEAMGEEIFGGPSGFANALLDISGGIQDYRVGVIDACPDPATFNVVGEGPTENDGDDENCAFDSGETWIEGDQSRDADEVISEFECVGRIDRVTGPGPDNNRTAGDCYGDNDDEQPASAAIAALAPDANPGFQRNDAVLVVIALTDEDEQPTPDRSAAQLYDELVARKGNVNNMVFLGIGGTGCGEDEGAYGGADDAQKLHALTDLFIAQDRGVWHDLCDGSLGDGLSAAIDVIETACNEFNPVD